MHTNIPHRHVHHQHHQHHQHHELTGKQAGMQASKRAKASKHHPPLPQSHCHAHHHLHFHIRSLFSHSISLSPPWPNFAMLKPPAERSVARPAPLPASSGSTAMSSGLPIKAPPCFRAPAGTPNGQARAGPPAAWPLASPPPGPPGSLAALPLVYPKAGPHGPAAAWLLVPPKAAPPILVLRPRKAPPPAWQLRPQVPVSYYSTLSQPGSECRPPLAPSPRLATWRPPPTR